MDTGNLPTQADLNSLMGSWNPMAYMQGFQNQDLANQFRQQAYQGNANTLQEQDMRNQHNMVLNPLLEQQQRDVNSGKQTSNVSSAIDLAHKQATDPETLALEREKLKTQLGDEKYYQLSQHILEQHMENVKSGDPAKIAETSPLLDLIGGKSGTLANKQQLVRGEKELKSITDLAKARIAAEAVANRPIGGTGKTPADPYVAWNKLPSSARAESIQRGLAQGVHPVTHEALTDTDRAALKAELDQAVRNIDQQAANRGQTQGPTFEVQPSGQFKPVNKHVPSVSGEKEQLSVKEMRDALKQGH